ncbi:molybdopterin-dependent oxidoreductase [Massilia sp. W12]|uniref:nitrate reductase n=1 Tax=Massilia sp. W12 TaxID=3126507 RepID=UPI0030CE1A55
MEAAGQIKEIKSACPYCGTGCGVLLKSDGRRILEVRGDPAHPANFGRLCGKGASLAAVSQAAQGARRLHTPLLRPARGAPLQEISWEQAYQIMTERMAQIWRVHGADAFGLYVSGQLLTEDYYVFNKLAKALLGTNNIDSNSRLCMSSAVAGYKQSLGADAPPCSYADLELADVVVIIGANPAWAHPVLYRRLEAARAARPEMKVIVIDPRRSDTAAEADLHLALLPGSDITLLNGILHLCCWEGWLDQAFIAQHTSGFAALREQLRDCTPALVAQRCGIAQDDLLQAARWIGQAALQDKRVLSLYCQGVNQSVQGVANNSAIINLHLALGQIGKPGAGPFSLTGQPNAMGGREVGAMANLASGHRNLGNHEEMAQIAAHWGLAAQDLPRQPGLTALQMFDAAAAGQLKMLWIACTNPAHSIPDQNRLRQALQTTPFVVVQEAMADVATLEYADLVLPAAAWGEKEGTLTNSERRISRVHAAIPAPGQALADWRIVCEVGRRLQQLLKPALPPLFAFDSGEAIWREHQALCAGRDLDISGLTYASLEQAPQQWPCPAPGQAQARLYQDGRFAHADGRARFIALTQAALPERCDAHYPFLLNTGRLRDQWHGMSRSGLLPAMFGHVEQACLQMARADMARRGWQDGQLVRVASRRGNLILPLQASDEVRSGQLFLPMHWGAEYLGGRQRNGAPVYGVNTLSLAAHDPVSRQPALKHAAVQLETVDLPWRMQIFAWDADAPALLAAVRPWLARFDYAACSLFGSAGSAGSAAEAHATGCGAGVRLWAGAASAPAWGSVQDLLALFGLLEGDILRYADPARGQARLVKLAGPRLQAAALLGDCAAADWLWPILRGRQDAPMPAWRLLGPQAPGGQPAPAAPMVCQCMQVSQAQLETLFSACPPDMDQAACLAHAQAQLQCGTACGSCVPQIKRMLGPRSKAAA